MTLNFWTYFSDLESNLVQIEKEKANEIFRKLGSVENETKLPRKKIDEWIKGIGKEIALTKESYDFADFILIFREII